MRSAGTAIHLSHFRTTFRAGHRTPQGLRAAPLALWQALVGPHFVSKTAMLLHTRPIIRRASPMGQARKL